jgi:hypothetical protein
LESQRRHGLTGFQSFALISLTVARRPNSRGRVSKEGRLRKPIERSRQEVKLRIAVLRKRIRESATENPRRIRWQATFRPDRILEMAAAPLHKLIADQLEASSRQC